MTSVPGASRFLNAATLANLRGIPAQQGTVLSDSSVSILSVGRSGLMNAGGVGLSASARALNETFLNRTSDINAMFSLGTGSGATIEGLQQQILALRASLPESALSRDLKNPDNGEAAAGQNGQVVDQEA